MTRGEGLPRERGSFREPKARSLALCTGLGFRPLTEKLR
jgi:hypothetical protein